MQARRLLIILMLVLSVVLLVAPGITLAQAEPVTIRLSVPEWMQQQFEQQLIPAFEAQNPTIRVQLSFGQPFFAAPATGVDSYLDDLEAYASSADVLLVGPETIFVEATRAGYFLDLSPLANGDASLNVSDFVPAAWQSFQWDSGIWALPLSASPLIITYDPAAFDRAGIAYPSDGWTMDDFANAARALAQRDSSGTVTTPGFGMFGTDIAALVYSLTGQGFYDSGVLPNAPNIDTPEIEALLTTWSTLVEEGAATNTPGSNYGEIPLRLEGSFGLGRITFAGSNSEVERQGALLPGGVSTLEARGFAVSGGTRYPEAAYTLAKFLTSSPLNASIAFGEQPARQSLVGVQPEPIEGGGIFFGGAGSPESDALVQQAMANAISASELRFGDYVERALAMMRDDGLDALSALQAAESEALGNLQTADTRATDTVIAVATPVPDVVLAPGEIALNFGVQSFVLPFPNREGWQQVISDFIAADPQVGQINLDTNPRQDIGVMAQETDCFYIPYNAVPDLDLSLVLNLDPFMDVDPNFNRADVVGNTLAQIQRENRTWALPVIIQPTILRYDTSRFEQAGIPAPTSGWAIEQFADALQQLKALTGDDAPFEARDFGGTYLLMLAAAYGGIPFDYRTDPPTVNLTDPANVNALRQVLDLAKNGLINYEQLAATGNVIALSNGGELPAIYTEALNGINVSIRIGGDEPVYDFTTYPSGSQYTALSYDIGTGYISAQTPYPDACYRFLSALAQHTELFNGMPVRRSQIQAQSQSPAAAAAYQQIDTLLQDPNTIIFPTPFSDGTPVGFLSRRWLNQAFDNYVLNDADLEAELAQAQTYITDFFACTAAIPPFDPAVGDRQENFQQYIDCATAVDPSTAQMFSFVSGG